MTASILRYFRPPIKPLPDAREDRIYQTAAGTVMQLGDRERDLNAWRDSYRFRTGRAA